MKDTALVTGGGGFIGSHIVDALVEGEFNVISLDNESAESNEQFYKNERAKNVFVDM